MMPGTAQATEESIGMKDLPLSRTLHAPRRRLPDPLVAGTGLDGRHAAPGCAEPLARRFHHSAGAVGLRTTDALFGIAADIQQQASHQKRREVALESLLQ